MKIVILGLSITSSWGNGHATTYRALIRELARRGHEVLFLERDQPWYAKHRDLAVPEYCRTVLYHSVAGLRSFSREIAAADCVIVGSYVPQGIAVGEWVCQTARGTCVFYDIDTPVTLAKLARDECPYLSRALVPRYHIYLSFTGGPTLGILEQDYGSPAARAFYCAVDPALYAPQAVAHCWALGYLGTYSADRQPALEQILLQSARDLPGEHFVVAGAQYPAAIDWPANVERFEHLRPDDHRLFYNQQRFTLNLTRADMLESGWSPSVRLFEAAACGVPIISDHWEGLEHFFTPGKEILIARSSAEVRHLLNDLPEKERSGIGLRARQRVLAAHTAAHRACELEAILQPAARSRRSSPAVFEKACRTSIPLP